MSYYYNGIVTLGIWAKKSGVWSKATEAQVEVTETHSAGGSRTIAFDRSFRVNLGSAVQAIGVTVESSNGVSATVDDIREVSWTAQPTGGGVRTASPNGEKCQVKVSPQ